MKSHQYTTHVRWSADGEGTKSYRSYSRNFTIAAQGKPVDTGGYYLPDQAKTSAGMRPSATLNAALATF